jgi:hypothetical protein
VTSARIFLKAVESILANGGSLRIFLGLFYNGGSKGPMINTPFAPVALLVGMLSGIIGTKTTVRNLRSGFSKRKLKLGVSDQGHLYTL